MYQMIRKTPLEHSPAEEVFTLERRTVVKLRDTGSFAVERVNSVELSGRRARYTRMVSSSDDFLLGPLNPDLASDEQRTIRLGCKANETHARAVLDLANLEKQLLDQADQFIDLSELELVHRSLSNGLLAGRQTNTASSGLASQMRQSLEPLEEHLYLYSGKSVLTRSRSDVDPGCAWTSHWVLRIANGSPRVSDISPVYTTVKSTISI